MVIFPILINFIVIFMITVYPGRSIANEFTINRKTPDLVGFEYLNPKQPVRLFRAFGETFGCQGPYAKPWICKDIKIDGIEHGSLLSSNRQPTSYLVTAPHGKFDTNTHLIVSSLFPSTYRHWNQLIAHSFRGFAPAGFFHNVNRPSLLDFDICENHPDLKKSKRVYQTFIDEIDRLSDELQLYVEIHGQNEPGLESTIEIATDRINLAEAETMRAIMIDTLKANHIFDVDIAIEPRDEIFFNATQTKRCGSINHVIPAAAIHLELPLKMRLEEKRLIQTIRFLRTSLIRIVEEVVDRR